MGGGEMDFSFVGTHSPAGWNEWYGTNVAVDDDGLRLASEPLPGYVSPRLVVDGEEFTPVDLTVDECDTLYILSEEGGIYRYETQIDALEPVPCLRRDGLNGRRPRAICVTRDTIYVADGRSEDAEDPTPGRVHAISKHVFQTRWILDDPFENPIGIATDGTTVYVVDTRGDAPDDPESGSLVTVTDDGTATTVLESLHTPRDVEVDSEGTPFVLDAEPQESAVRRIDTDDWIATETVGIDHGIVRPASFEVEDAETFLVGADEKTTGERVLFRFHKSDSEDEEVAPERLAGFKRSGLNLLLRRGDPTDDRTGLYAIDGTDHDIYFLDAERRTRLNPETGRYDGYAGTVLDADEFGMAWHRSVLAASESTGATRLELRYFATDEPIATITEIDGIGPIYGGRLRAANVTTITDLTALDPADIAEIAGTPVSRATEWHDEARAQIATEWLEHASETAVSEASDTLLFGAEGQYLWIRIDVLGTESTSPTLRSFRAFFPRQSYLRYLPAVFQEDEQSAEFLERFLSVFESVFVGIEEDIETATRFLDPGGIPAQYLLWLADWLALEADETWGEDELRSFVRQAPTLFKQRGTREGLLAVLDVFLDIDDLRPTAWEYALERERAELDEQVASKELTLDEAAAELDRLETPVWVLEYADTQCEDQRSDDTHGDDCQCESDGENIYETIVPCPRCFMVFVPPYVDDDRFRTVQRIVETQTPAHAVGRVVRLGSAIRLAGPDFAGHSYLGVNTVLSDGEFVVDEADLGGESVLTEREPYAQLELRSRLDEDARLS